VPDAVWPFVAQQAGDLPADHLQDNDTFRWVSEAHPPGARVYVGVVDGIATGVGHRQAVLSKLAYEIHEDEGRPLPAGLGQDAAHSYQEVGPSCAQWCRVTGSDAILTGVWARACQKRHLATCIMHSTYMCPMSSNASFGGP